MIAKKFFVTSGSALNNVSELNAYDLALKEAGIHQCNLVRVSSIIPSNCKLTKYRSLPIGSITFSVTASLTGKGKRISSGIAWGMGDKCNYGIVAEAEGFCNKNKIEGLLKDRITEMAKIRSIQVSKINYRIESIDVPEDYYGCVLASLIYLF